MSNNVRNLLKRGWSPLAEAKWNTTCFKLPTSLTHPADPLQYRALPHRCPLCLCQRWLSITRRHTGVSLLISPTCTKTPSVPHTAVPVHEMAHRWDRGEDTHALLSAGRGADTALRTSQQAKAIVEGSSHSAGEQLGEMNHPDKKPIVCQCPLSNESIKLRRNCIQSSAAAVNLHVFWVAVYWKSNLHSQKNNTGLMLCNLSMFSVCTQCSIYTANAHSVPAELGMVLLTPKKASCRQGLSADIGLTTE